jgi:arylsulfatase A-like enzyme
MTSCQEPNRKPNFLFILVDDLGYYDLGYTGSKYYETPNIDQIASSSMIFKNGYANCQVCSPSRASIMSGKYPTRHGITDYIGAPSGTDWRKFERHTKLLPAEYVDHLPHEYTTLPEAMKAGGYKTFFAGKWHLGGEGSYPEDHGFDINKGGYHQGGPYAGGYFSPFNNPKMKDHPEELGMSLPMRLAKETSQFISENKDSSFFAYLSFYAVHAPIQTTKENWKYYRQKAEEMGIADEGFEMERRLPIRKHQDNPVYAGLIEHMDDAVGKVLKTLKELGLEENTVVIFTSDNGGVASGDNFSTSLGPLRGGKGYQWEGGIKVPYFIKIPWMNHNGMANETPVTGTDFYPTILDLAGIPLRPEEHTDGVSLKPLLKGKSIPERSLFWHYPHYGNQGGDPSSIIQKGEWKLIHYYADDSDELYNIRKDIDENNNVAREHPDIRIRLKKELTTWLEKTHARYPTPDPLYDSNKARIKHLEYINRLMPHLEKERKNMLQKDWQPNEDWWGSRN